MNCDAILVTHIKSSEEARLFTFCSSFLNAKAKNNHYLTKTTIANMTNTVTAPTEMPIINRRFEEGGE